MLASNYPPLLARLQGWCYIATSLLPLVAPVTAQVWREASP